MAIALKWQFERSTCWIPVETIERFTSFGTISVCVWGGGDGPTNVEVCGLNLTCHEEGVMQGFAEIEVPPNYVADGAAETLVSPHGGMVANAFLGSV